MSIEELTRRALSDYFTSAVVFDDRLGYEPEGHIPESVAPPDVAGFGVDGSQDVESDGEVERPGVDVTIPVPALVESFAREGIVCTAFDPSHELGHPPDQLPEHLTKLASLADITIIDWYVEPAEPGEVAVSLIKALARGEHGLQFVVVYTEHDREVVAERLDQLEDVAATDRGAWTSESVVVCYVNKSDVPIDRLAGHVMVRAAEQLSGLMRVAAIRSAARVRRAMPHTLELLGPSADAAILSHTIVKDHEDARQLAASLVRDELLAPAEQEGLHDLFQPDGFVERAVTGLPSRAGRSLTLDDGGKPVTVEIADWSPDKLQALLGADEKKEAKAGDWWNRIGELLVDNPGHGSKLRNGKPLGALSSCFIEYGRVADRRMLALTATTFGWPRTIEPDRVVLGPGLILEVDDPSGRWLCVTPECDTVRLKGKTDFHFLPIRALEEGRRSFHSPGSDNMPLELGGEEEAPVVVDMSFNALRRFRLTPNEGAGVAELRPNTRVEADMSDPELEQWVSVTVAAVASLKPDLTNRIRHALATHGSRIGLVEFSPDDKHRRAE